MRGLLLGRDKAFPPTKLQEELPRGARHPPGPADGRIMGYPGPQGLGNLGMGAEYVPEKIIVALSNFVGVHGRQGMAGRRKTQYKKLKKVLAKNIGPG